MLAFPFQRSKRVQEGVLACVGSFSSVFFGLKSFFGLNTSNA